VSRYIICPRKWYLEALWTVPAGIAVGVHSVLLATTKIPRIHDHSASYLNTGIMTVAYRLTMKEVQLLIMFVCLTRDCSRFFDLFILEKRKELTEQSFHLIL